MYLLLIFTHSSLMQRSRNVQDVLNAFCTFFSSWTSSFRAYTASTRLLRKTNRESSLGVHNIDPEWHRVRIRLWCSLLLDDSLPVALHLLHDDFLFLWQKHLRHTLFPYSCHTHTQMFTKFKGILEVLCENTWLTCGGLVKTGSCAVRLDHPQDLSVLLQSHGAWGLNQEFTIHQTTTRGETAIHTNIHTNIQCRNCEERRNQKDRCCVQAQTVSLGKNCGISGISCFLLLFLLHNIHYIQWYC